MGFQDARLHASGGHIAPVPGGIAHFPGILSKQTEASESILTSQTWLVCGHTQTLQSQISGLV